MILETDGTIVHPTPMEEIASLAEAVAATSTQEGTDGVLSEQQRSDLLVVLDRAQKEVASDPAAWQEAGSILIEASGDDGTVLGSVSLVLAKDGWDLDGYSVNHEGGTVCPDVGEGG